LRRESSAAPTFRDAGHFAVNILGEEQDHLCRIFAGRNADKFSGLRIGDGIGGVPLLSGVSACLECRTEAIHPGGDHLIFVGRVEGLALSHDIRPLIHCRGAFLSVTAAQDSVVGTMPEFCPGMPNYSS
jgi:flavin reductase (DIM6/NTAB) family NADH-FMN oxidoreductase RutF